MRCRRCSYELWNMVPGACPECGSLWRFEEFRFRPHRAQFLCPHCSTAYAGTGESGLPEPRKFVCRSCSGEIALHEMRALPAPGTDGTDAMDDAFVWSERSRVGRFKAWRTTVWWSLVEPRKLGRSLPHHPRFRDALKFALVSALVPALATIVPILVLVIGMQGATAGPPGLAVAEFAFFGAALALIPASLLALVLLWALAAHGILALTGPIHRGMGVTTAIALYSGGALLLASVPCLGIYLSWISFIVMANTMVFALSVAQAVPLWRATVAVLAPLLVVIAGVAFAFYWVVSTAITGTTTLTPASALAPAPALVAPSDPNALPSGYPEAGEEEKSSDDEFPAETDPNPE